MTNEIWAAVIIAIIQIIVAVAVGWKQINIAKALANPEQNQVKPRKNRLDNILKYFSRIPLHIIFPSIIFAVIAISSIYKYGYSFKVLVYLFMILIILLFEYVIWFILKSLGIFAKALISHEGRLKCHETMLSGLTDKPCKEDGKCKIDV